MSDGHVRLRAGALTVSTRDVDVPVRRWPGIAVEPPPYPLLLLLAPVGDPRVGRLAPLLARHGPVMMPLALPDPRGRSVLADGLEVRVDLLAGLLDTTLTELAERRQALVVAAHAAPLEAAELAWRYPHLVGGLVLARPRWSAAQLLTAAPTRTRRRMQRVAVPALLLRGAGRAARPQVRPVLPGDAWSSARIGARQVLDEPVGTAAAIDRWLVTQARTGPG